MPQRIRDPEQGLLFLLRHPLRRDLYTVMLRQHNVYWPAANAAERVLKEPTLLDASS